MKTSWPSSARDRLAPMLREDCLTYLLPITQDQFPELGPTLEYAEEVRCATRMLAGESLIDPGGGRVAPMTGLWFQAFEQRGEWRDTGSGELIAGVRTALYDVSIIFDRGGGDTLHADGQIKFYAASRDSLHKGAMRQYWQIVGQQDLTIGSKSVENSTWGSVKAMYR